MTDYDDTLIDPADKEATAMIGSGRKMGQAYASIMGSPHGGLVVCASEQHKRDILALAKQLGRPDVRAVKYDEVFTTDPSDCEAMG